jgi:predicted Zn-dependent peptidase
MTLKNRLRNQLCLTYNVSSKCYQIKDINYYFISFDCNNDNLEKCIYESVILFNQIYNNGFDIERYTMVKENLKNDLLINNEKIAYETDTNIIINNITKYLDDGISFENINNFINIIDKFSLEEMNNLFKKIFTKNNCSVLIRSNSNNIKSKEYIKKLYDIFNIMY